jgi:hypothetical protein
MLYGGGDLTFARMHKALTASRCLVWGPCSTATKHKADRHDGAYKHHLLCAGTVCALGFQRLCVDWTASVPTVYLVQVTALI